MPLEKDVATVTGGLLTTAVLKDKISAESSRATKKNGEVFFLKKTTGLDAAIEGGKRS
jgi:hypothetical protein